MVSKTISQYIRILFEGGGHSKKVICNSVFKYYSYGPTTGPAFLRFLALWYVGGVGVGGGVITSCVYVIIGFLRWTHFILRCTLLLYIGEHTSCYVTHFCCTSVKTLHVTLRTSVVLRWTHFRLRCTLLLYFGDQRLCALFSEAA